MKEFPSGLLPARILPLAAPKRGGGDDQVPQSAT